MSTDFSGLLAYDKYVQFTCSTYHYGVLQTMLAGLIFYIFFYQKTCQQLVAYPFAVPEIQAHTPPGVIQQMY